MRLETRPYGGRLFRPEPEVHISDDHSVVIVATPWGNPQIAKDFISIFLNHWRDAQHDTQKTVSLMDDSLSLPEHLFKLSLLAAHEDIKDKYNDEELSAAVEVLCLLKNQKKLTWFQVGAPSMVLIRSHELLPLFHNTDFSHDYSNAEQQLPPLPKNLLGLQQRLNIGIGNLKYKSGDRLLLVSRYSIPFSFFQQINGDNVDLDAITHLFATDNADQPFWLGLISVD